MERGNGEGDQVENNTAAVSCRLVGGGGGGVMKYHIRCCSLEAVYELSLGVVMGDSKPETDWSWEDQLRETS